MGEGKWIMMPVCMGKAVPTTCTSGGQALPHPMGPTPGPWGFNFLKKLLKYKKVFGGFKNLIDRRKASNTVN